MTDRPKILIVDDREENLVALRTILNDVDAEVLEATNGNDALTATLNHNFALAILDVQMPGMDGYELADYMQEGSHTDKIPVIFLTANYSGEDKISRGYEKGAVDYLVKPYDPLILLSKVGVFLTLYRQRLELKNYSEQLESAYKELEAFSYSVSHDLKAPLRHVSGYVELLNKHCQSDLSEKGLHYLNSIGDSVHIMGMLIDDLLQFSRTGRMEMRQSHLDMNGIVKEVKESLSKDNPDRKIEWILGKLPSVNGDGAMLKLVWTNLLSNAAKFTRTRKKTRIEIGVSEEDKELVFFVRDNGVGFDMQYAHKLFGVFQRLHPAEEFEGTGIGLANVQRIVLRHGGRTWAEAEPDKGAVFYFSLPNK